jgi:GNAT superfamily N-acetyltransferase
MIGPEGKTSPVTIVPFSAEHTRAFGELNLAWVSRYFTVEDKDLEQIEGPQSAIIDKGGAILIAQDDSYAILGCVALIPNGADSVELAKMAVAEAAQGRGIGRLLMDAAIETAKGLGTKSIYLESNSKLESAVKVYERSGFVHLPVEARPHSPYARCNVAMSLIL